MLRAVEEKVKAHRESLTKRFSSSLTSVAAPGQLLYAFTITKRLNVTHGNTVEIMGDHVLALVTLTMQLQGMTVDMITLDSSYVCHSVHAPPFQGLGAMPSSITFRRSSKDRPLCCCAGCLAQRADSVELARFISSQHAIVDCELHDFVVDKQLLGC